MKDSKRRSRIKQKRINAHLERVNLFAAGIDIGSQSHYVAIPEGLDSDPRWIKRNQCSKDAC